jgi:hypothetical protein
MLIVGYGYLMHYRPLIVQIDFGNILHVISQRRIYTFKQQRHSRSVELECTYPSLADIFAVVISFGIGLNHVRVKCVALSAFNTTKRKVPHLLYVPRTYL